MSSKRKIVSDSIVLTVGNYVVKLRGLVFMPIIIKAVGLTTYGVFVQITTNISMIHPFCTLALGEGFRRFTSKTPDSEVSKLSSDYWTVIITSILSSIVGASVIFFLSPLVCEYLFKEVTLDILWASRISALMVVERVLWEQMNNYLMGRKRFKVNTFLSLGYKFFPYIGLTVGLIIENSLAWGIGLFFAVELVFVVGLFVKLLTELPFSRIDFATLKSFFRYSWSLTLNQFEGGLLAKVDRYFISYVLGPASLGAYNIIYSVVGFLDDISIPFRRYYSSYLPKLWDEGNREKALHQIRTGLRYFFVLSWTSLILIVLGLEPLIAQLLGEKAPKLEQFQLIVLITGLGIVAEGARRLYAQIIALRQLNHYRVLFHFIAVVVNVVLNYLLVPVWGLVGAATATLVSYWIILLLNARLFSIDAGMKFYRKLTLAVIASVPAMLISFLHPPQNIVLACTFGLAFFIYFMLIIISLKLVDVNELKSFLSRR